MPPNLQIYEDELQNKPVASLKQVLGQFQQATQTVTFTSGKTEDKFVDFNEEAVKLYEQLNLPVPTGDNKAATKSDGPDCVWVNPDTGAKLYIGNQNDADDLEGLEKLEIFHIINCKGSEGKNKFQKDRRFQYLRFGIGEEMDN